MLRPLLPRIRHNVVMNSMRGSGLSPSRVNHSKSWSVICLPFLIYFRLDGCDALMPDTRSRSGASRLP